MLWDLAKIERIYNNHYGACCYDPFCGGSCWYWSPEDRAIINAYEADVDEYYANLEPDPEEEPDDIPEEFYSPEYDHLDCCEYIQEPTIDDINDDDIYLCVDCEEQLTDNQIDARLEGGEVELRCDDCYGEHYGMGK